MLLSQLTPGHIELYSASVNVTTCVFFHTLVYVSIFFILPSSAVSTVDVIDVNAVFGIELNFAVFTVPVVNWLNGIKSFCPDVSVQSSSCPSSG